jgi:hypothetical protein
MADFTSLADVQLHVIDSFLTSREKLIFLQVNGQTYEALKDGNMYKQYSQHFCSDKEYALSWSVNHGKDKSSFFLPHMENTDIREHKVNVAQACAFCRHKIDETAVLLPALYTPNARLPPRLAYDGSHFCRADCGASVTDMKDSGIFHADLSPYVMEYYMFGLAGVPVKKYTTLVCSSQCEDRFIRTLEAAYEGFGWAIVSTSIESILQMNQKQALTRLFRRITTSATVEVTINWYNCGAIIKDYAFTPRNDTSPLGSQALTIYGHSFLILHAKSEPLFRNACVYKNLREHVKKTGKMPYLNGGGVGRPHLSQEEVFIYARRYFELVPHFFSVWDVDEGVEQVYSAEYAFEVTYFYHSSEEEWRFNSTVKPPVPLDDPEGAGVYEYVVLHQDLLRQSWAHATTPINGEFRVENWPGTWAVRSYDEVLEGEELLSEESIEEIDVDFIVDDTDSDTTDMMDDGEEE